MINIWTASDNVAKPKKLNSRTMVRDMTNRNARTIEGLSQLSMSFFLNSNFLFSNCGSDTLRYYIVWKYIRIVQVSVG